MEENEHVEVVGCGFVPGIPGIFGNNHIKRSGEVIVPPPIEVSQPAPEQSSPPSPEPPQEDHPQEQPPAAPIETTGD